MATSQKFNWILTRLARQTPGTRSAIALFYLALCVQAVVLAPPALAAGPNAKTPDTAADSKDAKSVNTTNAGDDPSDDRALADALAERLTAAMTKLLPTGDFILEVEAALKGGQLSKSAYIPGGPTPQSLMSWHAAQLVKATSRLSVTLSLPKDLDDQGLKRKIEAMFDRRFGINAARGDKVAFESLSYRTRSRSAEEKALERTEADLRAARAQADLLRKERDDLKLESTSARSETSQLGRELEKARAVPAAKELTLQGAIKANLPVLSGIALLLIIGVLVSWSFVQSGRGVAKAVAAVANALETAGSAIVQITNQTDGKRDEPAENVVATASASGLALNSADPHLQRRLLKIHEEVVALLTPDAEASLVAYLHDLMSDEGGAPKAVAALEMLGRERANNFFQRLGAVVQQSLLAFMREGRYQRSKIELMIEAGEELKTRFLGDFVGGDNGQNPQLTGAFLKLSDEELAAVLVAIDADALSRSLVHLPTKRLTQLINTTAKSDASTFDRIAAALPLLPTMSQMKASDRQILTLVERAGSDKNTVARRAYLKVYAELVASADEAVSERLTRHLNSDPDIAAYLARHVVQVATLFKLSDALRKELVAGLANADLAALLTTELSEAERGMLTDGLPERRRDAVIEDSARMASRGNQALEQARRQARTNVVKALKLSLKDGTNRGPATGSQEAAVPRATGTGDTDQGAA